MNISKIFLPQRCYNGGAQHNFRARYSQHNKTTPTETAFWYRTGDAAVPLQDEEIETYHGDVCQWCGAVVNKPKT